MIRIVLFTLLIAICCPAYALEIFLNDNRSETGTIGFIDIDKVFQSYSGTVSSKEELDKEIRRKEEELGRRRTRIYKYKAKSAKLRQEKELASILPEMLENRRKAEQAEEQIMQDQERIRKEREDLDKQEEKLKQDSSALRQDSEQIEKEREELKKKQLENEKTRFILDLRQNGVPEDNIQAMLKEKFPENEKKTEGQPENNVVSDTKTEDTAQQKEKKEEANANKKEETDIRTTDVKKASLSEKKEEKAKKETKDIPDTENKTNQNANNNSEQENEDISETFLFLPIPELPLSKYGEPIDEDPKADLYTVNIPGIGDFSFSVSTEPARIQEEIDRLESQIMQEEESAKKYEERAEKELSEYEDAQTKRLLGTIYSALKKISEQEEISVIVDKRNILYGKNTVDLTQKLLDLLETPEEE